MDKGKHDLARPRPYKGSGDRGLSNIYSSWMVKATQLGKVILILQAVLTGSSGYLTCSV